MPITFKRNCNFCKNPYSGSGKFFCSFKCRGANGISTEIRKKLSIANKGQIPWIKGKKLSIESRQKMSESRTGIKSALWKGEKAKYQSIHQWVIKWKGSAKFCEQCGKTRNKNMLHWSNVDHKYRRILEDYRSLCVSCHKKYDLSSGLCKH